MQDLLRESPGVRVVDRISPRLLADEIQSLLADRLLPPALEIRESVLGYSWSRTADAIIFEYRKVINQQEMDNDAQVSVGASG